MKRFVSRMAITLVVCALLSTTALAAGKSSLKSKHITVGVDFVVGDTLVKKGTYKWTFNKKTNELTITAKDKTVVAKTVARLEKRDKAAIGTHLVFAERGGNKALISLAFPGDSQDIVIDSRGIEVAVQ